MLSAFLVSGRSFALVALAGCLSLVAGSSWAGWLDQMPSVDDVARAVRQQNRLDAGTMRPGDGLRRINGLKPSGDVIGIDDEEWYAARLAGTFKMLRWLMLFEALRETNPTLPGRWMPLSDPRASTLARAAQRASEYREMELLLERGAGRRSGYARRLCDRKDSFLNRFGQKMYTAQECYGLQFRIHSNLAHVAGYRQAIFPRLFCEKGPYFQERFREYFNDGNDAADRFWDRPHNFVFKRIGQWPTIASQRSGPEICVAHGGDADGDGVCDAWQRQLRETKAETPGRQCAVCPDPPAQSGTKPFTDLDSAAVAASQVALSRQSTAKTEYGGYVYPVAGGYRYMEPVTSGNGTQVDLRNDVDPAFAKLFPNRDPASCNRAAVYHSHPDSGSPWSGGRLPGLSLADLHTAVGENVPVYVIDGHTRGIYVYEPGNAEADAAVASAKPRSPVWVQELYYNTRYVRRLTSK